MRCHDSKSGIPRIRYEVSFEYCQRILCPLRPEKRKSMRSYGGPGTFWDGGVGSGTEYVRPPPSQYLVEIACRIVPVVVTSGSGLLVIRRVGRLSVDSPSVIIRRRAPSRLLDWCVFDDTYVHEQSSIRSDRAARRGLQEFPLSPSELERSITFETQAAATAASPSSIPLRL